ncbi:hypothetical protein BJ998_005000 [Kutzneria kofuensis]|uniref:Uncharacterized protein n=1 Tax=Kutzneria kofuensis TaxID=103725 RepID=A0A7W9KJP8_9PSEU|nr:hypothetical protein [Kutzneria kofuensis]
MKDLPEHRLLSKVRQCQRVRGRLDRQAGHRAARDARAAVPRPFDRSPTPSPAIRTGPAVVYSGPDYHTAVSPVTDAQLLLWLSKSHFVVLDGLDEVSDRKRASSYLHTSPFRIEAICCRRRRPACRAVRRSSLPMSSRSSSCLAIRSLDPSVTGHPRRTMRRETPYSTPSVTAGPPARPTDQQRRTPFMGQTRHEKRSQYTTEAPPPYHPGDRCRSLKSMPWLPRCSVAT